MRKFTLKILFLFLLPTFLFGQVADSIVLTADQLLLDDILSTKTATTDHQIFAATRSLKNLKDLPFTVYIITKKEIRDNGYRTLVDALKMQPGIRISQPGSGLDGETFLMRGLNGNAYTKILLNGNPIKPSVVRGMPIGAQIPIQQAERIEIIYGAMGTLFGADASSGIINIVLEETERPVYTQANLSLGSNEYTNLDVSFGGRLGKQRNTLRYSLFGSYTFRGDLNIEHSNDSLFNPANYFVGSVDYAKLENFISDGNGKQLINDLPHQSRLVGINLEYLNMKLSVETMYRRDHSSIGLNPFAVSYTNPLNYTGERIVNANFLIKRRYQNWGFEGRISYLQYRMDNRSSNDYIVNSTSGLLDVLSNFEALDAPNSMFDAVLYDSLTKSHFSRYFDGTRFSFSESADAGATLILDLYPRSNLDIKFGFVPRYSRSVPLVNYSRVPLGSILFKNEEAPTTSDLSPFIGEEVKGFEVSTFVQAYWKLKKWIITGGFQYYINGENIFYKLLLESSNDKKRSADFRVAANYKITDNWNLRAFYGTAFRVPTAFYKATTFDISLKNETPIQNTINELDPESSKTFEIGMRWTPNKKNFFDAVGFYTKTSNLIGYNVIIQQAPGDFPTQYSQGFYNSQNSRMSLYGAQMNYLFHSTSLDFGFNMTLSFGKEKLAGSSERNTVSEQPKTIRKTRIVVRPTSRISLTFDTVLNSGADNRIRGFGRERLSRFRTIDILSNYNINRNFKVFCKVYNIFNNEYSGLSATTTIDDLFYNPQEKRFFRVGMSYRID